MVLLSLSPGPIMAGAGRRTIVLRRRAAMAGNEWSPVHLHPNHLHV